MIRRVLIALALLVLAPLPVAAQDDLAVETARVQDLMSVRAIKLLQAQWGHAAIEGQWESMSYMVASDATMEIAGVTYSGREAIETYLRDAQGGGVDGMAEGRLNLRLWLTPVITLAADGQSATGRWHEIAMTAAPGEESSWAGGTWVIDYRDGSYGWEITAMRYYSQFAGDYATGWSHEAATLERAPYHYTPEEAGSLLPHRAAEFAYGDADLDRFANQLLGASQAQNLVSAYGYYLDRGMYDDVEELFADNSDVMVMGQGKWFNHDGLRRYLRRFGKPGLDHGELNDRVQLMPVVTSMGDSMVTVQVIEIGMSGQHGGAARWSATWQYFELLRDPDGVWFIGRLIERPLMQASYATGWDGAAVDLSTLVAGGEPDEPFDCVVTGSDYDCQLPVGMFSSVPTGYSVPHALDRAEAFDAAENISNAYGYYIDQFAWRNTAALFSRDGWKELSYIGTFIGQDNVLGSLIQRYGEGGPRDEFQAIHQLTQPYVTPSEDGQRAQIRSRLWQFNSSTEPGGSWIGGIYENQVIREDGVWRIHGMDLDYVWLADVATGWTGVDPEANARFGVSEDVIAEFGPQAPLRGEVFAPYPRIAPMGFHYANPVSGREPATRLHWSDGYRSE